nr:serine/arginine repetitive matrix protein 1-like [Aegilops tauschii subsp. strangulata]
MPPRYDGTADPSSFLLANKEAILEARATISPNPSPLPSRCRTCPLPRRTNPAAARGHSGVATSPCRPPLSSRAAAHGAHTGPAREPDRAAARPKCGPPARLVPAAEELRRLASSRRRSNPAASRR